MVDVGLSSFKRILETFPQDGKPVTKPVYYIGTSGPGVLLMHELPGVTPGVLRLASLIAARGYRVSVPSLFGTDGKSEDPLYLGESFTAACISREFNVWAADGSSPIIDWLRELAKHLAQECGGPGVGVIGLCITGGFALSLTVGTDGKVKAAVMGQPSLPFSFLFSDHDSAIHLSEQEHARINADAEPPVLAVRFTNDGICKASRFSTYRDVLRARLETIEITSPDPTHGISAGAHGVLTKELRLDDVNHPTYKALQRVFSILDRALKA